MIQYVISDFHVVIGNRIKNSRTCNTNKKLIDAYGKIDNSLTNTSHSLFIYDNVTVCIYI